ncbi:MAG: penicillin-binding protein 2 [Lachnospiraceae bacterium]|nr:penicillin-binding protein 2 [Lachnospiraceae bacterium]
MAKEKRRRKLTVRSQAKIVSNRLGVIFLIVLLAFVGLSARLIYITKENNNDYQHKILSQQAYDSQVINAKRGEIVDRNGTVLATSKESYNVILDVKNLLLHDENEGNTDGLEHTLTALKNVFDIDTEKVRQYIKDTPKSQYYQVKKGVTYEDMSRFLMYTTKPEDEKQTDSLYDKNVNSVWFEKYYVRFYPQNTLACDTIGFSLNNGTASYGLEEYYNDLLTGVNGRKYGFLGDNSTQEITTIPASDGYKLVTTLDSNISLMVKKHLKDFMLEYKDNVREGFGANNVGCIIMNAKTGEILAMESYPDFDLNDPTDISEYYTEEQINTMKEEGTLKDTYDALWKNFCIQDTYEPGSVMKPFTVAMGLETGTIKGNEGYQCNGYLTIGGHEIYCHNRAGDGWLDIKGAVAQSCNVALMYMSRQIGAENFLDYQEVFNFGLRTNIDLTGETRTDSVVFNENTLHETELATASFGQGFNVTMIQMIAGYAALVNGGYYYEPHVVNRILTSGGSVVKNIEPRVVKQVISETTSAKIREYCNAVVTDGTGWRAKPAGYQVGGKTGTAETVPRGNGEYVVSFMCHAPADDPEIICYVVVDRPNVSVQEDAKYATIISHEILTDVLPYLNIPMTEDLTETDIASLEERELSILTNRGEKEEEENTEAESEESENTENGGE